MALGAGRGGRGQWRWELEGGGGRAQRAQRALRAGRRGRAGAWCWELAGIPLSCCLGASPHGLSSWASLGSPTQRGGLEG